VKVKCTTQFVAYNTVTDDDLSLHPTTCHTRVHSHLSTHTCD